MKKTCPRTHCSNLAVVDPIFGILPCLSCQAKDTKTKITKSPEFYSINKMHRVQKIRDKSARDLLQPFIGNRINPDFAKAYPDKAKDHYTKRELESL